ncbi:ScbR family autoregulator-binding transcription factor [Kitasatospora aureofaciens]|uniref:ScbR family autoregulator-binding transcription factor n=1 Tax=Kitasatospora aureofaciens TaxID=1894 RepID=UPI0027E07C8B|nr:ScbR family autoregulator-binding transcription factor [Kitasatospora aureofaciens]
MAVRQERAVRTREMILEAAAEVFDESGYAGASIMRIMERAETTQGAIYFHFKSKEDLARAVIMYQAARLYGMPQEARGLQQLIDLTFYLAHELQRNVVLRAGVRLAVEQSESGLAEYSIYQEWIECFRAELSVARAQGELRPEADEDAFAAVLVAGFTGSQVMSQIASGRADLPDRITRLWRCLMPGIAAADMGERLVLDPQRGREWAC